MSRGDIEILVRVDSPPPQMKSSGPMVLIDAFDQPLPFYLEIVSSKSMLMAISKEQYKDAGLRKLKSREFD